METYIMILVYIYMCVCVCVCVCVHKNMCVYIHIHKKTFRCRFKEKKKYFKMNRSTQRSVFFLKIYLFISFLHTSKFPACCFARGLLNGVLNET